MNKISFKKNGLGEIKGLYYEVSKTSLKLSELFFERHISGSYLSRYMCKVFKSTKYECYVKKHLAYDFFETLAGLHLVKEFSEDKRIIMNDTLINRFALNEFSKNNKTNFNIFWLGSSWLFWPELFLYYLIIMKNFFGAGISFKNRRNVKLYKEAAWGCNKPVLRDDFLIDNINFTKNDIIFYFRYRTEEGRIAEEQLRDSGYTVINLNKCSFNVKKHFLSFIKIFIFQPFYVFSIMFFNKTAYLSDFALKFYLESLAHFKFLANYNAKCHLSVADHGEVAETMIMNMFGCKNILCNWSDKTPFKDVLNSFTAHNVFYSWGPIHYEFLQEYYYYNKVVMVGNFLLKAYFDSLANSKEKHLQAKKTILLCDTSFSNAIMHSEKFYIDYLDLAIEMLNGIDDADFIFKSKYHNSYILDNFSDKNIKNKYLENMKLLNKNKRFFYYDSSFQLEPFIAGSDIVITMGMTSPSTIALTLHKEAVFYDITGNNQHPMTKYLNSVVFSDKKLLIEYIKEVLNNKKSVFDLIDIDLLNSYDSYKDSKALERLVRAVYNETECSTNN